LIRKGEEETLLAISGGFFEVRPDRVILLADTAERAEEIDIARAEEARKRAAQKISEYPAGGDLAQVEAALRRSLIRIKVAEKRRKKIPGA
jgi:F-type H+-transporting ATPase subunit epsilon